MFRINVILSISLIYFLFVISDCMAQSSLMTRYDINIVFNPNTHSLEGRQNVTYSNRSKQSLESIYFVLPANHSREKNPYLHPIQTDLMFWDGWEPTSTDITYVKDIEDQPLKYKMQKAPSIFQNYSLDEVLLKVELSESLLPGQSIQLKMGFKTQFAHNKFGDQAYWQSVYTWRFAWNPIERAMLDGQWDTQGFRMIPGFYTVTMVVPNEYEVAAGSDIRTIINEDENTVTYYFESEVPQLSVPIVIGKGLRKFELKTGAAVIESYYRGEYEPVARLLATYAQEIIAYFKQHFGPYQYRKLVIADVSSPFTSMAADGLVLMSRNFYKYKDLLVPGLFDRLVIYVLAHEIGHLWWGVGVTADFAGENWLSEAFANYLAYSYIEHKYGTVRNYYNYEQSDVFTKLLSYIIGDSSFRQRSEGRYLNTYYLGWDEAIVKPPSEVKFENVSSARIYEKGYWVLRALESQMGKEDMFKAMNITFEQYHSQQFTIKQFQSICEQVEGESLDWFFQQWLYSPAYLDYSIEKVSGKKKDENYETEIVIGKKGKSKARTKIKITTKNTETELKGIMVDNKSNYKVSTKEEVTKVTVDPDAMLPDVYRINNTWPRKIKTRFGLNDDPLDAYSIRYYFLPSSIEVPASGSSAAGLGFGVSGGYSPTHQWAINLSTGFRDDRSYLSSQTYYQYRFSSRNFMSFNSNITGYDVNKSGQTDSTVQISHLHTLFETPQLGSSSRFLLAANRLQNSLLLQDNEGWYQHEDHLSYKDDEYNGPHLLWRITYQRDDRIRRAWQNRLGLDVSVPGVNDNDFYKFQYSTYKSFRIIPKWILSLSAGLGFSSKTTPTPNKFGLSHLNSYFGENYGLTQLTTTVELDFPWLRELEIPLLNTVVIDSVSVNVFSSIATLGNDFGSLGLINAAESGVQLKLGMVTFGGFINFTTRIGYVLPWYADNTEEDPNSGVFFRLGLNVPLN